MVVRIDNSNSQNHQIKVKKCISNGRGQNLQEEEELLVMRYDDQEQPMQAELRLNNSNKNYSRSHQISQIHSTTEERKAI